jgi:predicted enzyme related to lactoylglutathione lyase
MDVQDLGRMAILTDQAGVLFGLWQPGRNKGLEVVQEPGSLCWLELYTADVPAAAAFYHSVLGLETFGVDFPGATYTTFHPAGEGEDAMFGGVVPLADAPGEEEAYWLPYFEVTDPDAIVARAQELGGTIRMPATDLPDIGRLAKLADPYGARFAVIHSEPQQS